MNERQQLLSNLDKINVTEISEQLIRENLHIDPDSKVIDYCKQKLADENCDVSKMGSNWFCRTGNVVIPVNTVSYTILTAHLIR